MKRVFGVALLLLGLATQTASAQAKRIDKNLYGMNIERDQFFSTLFNATAAANMKAWLADLNVGNVRVGIPFDGTTNSWWPVCWQEAADFHTTTGINVTFFFGSAWWPTGQTQSAHDQWLLDFGAKVQQFAGKIAYYELGNEIDTLKAGDPTVSVDRYKVWLSEVSAVIRAKDPAAKIIMISCNIDSASKPLYQEMLTKQCWQYVDYYSLHCYPQNNAGQWNPQSATWPLQDFLLTQAQTFNTMVAAIPGTPKKSLLITEAGYPLLGPTRQPFADTTYQNRWNTTRTARFWAKDVVDTYPIERVDVFCGKDFTVGVGPQQFGLLQTDDTKRPQYFGMKNTYSLLNGTIFLKERPVNSLVKCYEYLKENGQKVTMIWSGRVTDAGGNLINSTTSVPLGSTTGSVYGSTGSLVSSPSNVASVALTYSQDPAYLLSGNAQAWKEGESPSSANFTATSTTNAQCYNGRHLSIFTTTAADRQASYTITVPRPGTYTVFASSTPGNVSWASPFQYCFNSGTAYSPATPWTNASAGATQTGVAYGTSNAMAWRSLGEFTATAAGSWTITFRVNTPISTGQYVFYLDSVYVEPKV
ncbi:MAG: hypothetical protein JWM57_3632 [Phycisphaerales bacterium]|nr:hypothetical protein [Phycisphaerales bacterium]